MSQEVEKIANRHVARCLTKIEEVHNLPEVCADVVRREMHYCAKDVAAALVVASVTDVEVDTESAFETRGNR